MNLLTDRVFETDNSIKLIDLLCKTLSNCVDGKFCVSKFITYDDFKVMIHTFIVEIMESFFKDNNHNEDTFNVHFKRLPRNIKGNFNRTSNTVTISDMVIKNMYDCYLDDIEVLFHELNHFKIKYEILDGVINEDICRIVKEMLIRRDGMDPFNEIGSWKSFKGRHTYINDDYYDDNYMNYSEEVIARIGASNDLVLFMRILCIYGKINNSEVNKALDKMLEDLVREDEIRYNIHIRDFNSSLSFNSNYLSFYEAFDFLVKYNPKWLEYPQIGIEYYIDGDNKVKKRDSVELYKLLENTSDEDTRKYIEKLIDNMEKKKINLNTR